MIDVPRTLIDELLKQDRVQAHLGTNTYKVLSDVVEVFSIFF